MKKVLIIGSSGLNNLNNSTNNRMKKIFEVLHNKYGFVFDYYQLRPAVLQVDYINYINKEANPSSWDAFRIISSKKIKYDIALAETFNAAIVAYLIYLRKKTPFIWRQFGTTFNDELEFKNYIKPKVLVKFILHKLIANSKGCKAIVVTEDGCANRTLYLDKLHVRQEKLYMVKNQRTEQKSQKNIVSKSNNKDIFRLVQIGRITQWKKIHLVLDAIINIKNRAPEIAKKIQFNIVGKTQDKEYEDFLLNKIVDNQLEEHIFFLKDLQYHEIEKLLRDTDLSISLTAYNPIIESLQNSIPVITYEYGEIGEVFNACSAVFILSKDIKKSSLLSIEQEKNILDALEEKIIFLYENRKDLKEIGTEGKKFVEENFPVLDEHVKEVIGIYMKVIDAL